MILSMFVLFMSSCNTEPENPFVGSWYCHNTTETYVFTETEIDITDVVNGVAVTHYVVTYTFDDDFITINDSGYVSIYTYDIDGNSMSQTRTINGVVQTLNFTKQ